VPDPAGVVRAANQVGGGGTIVFCAYPDNFGPAASSSAGASGTYTVTWRERKLPGPSKWHSTDVSRFKVPA
jgi:hypothetical protein